MLGRKYPNPPLLEAVCEFRFTEDTKWDLTIPGLLFDKIKDEFPNKEQRIVQEVDIIQEPQGMRQQLKSTERVLFLTADRRLFVQLGTRLLSINCLNPYPSWEGFKPRIIHAFEAMGKTIEIRNLQRIGLRYINRIEIPGGDSLNLSDYFEFRPLLGPKLPQNMTESIVACSFPYFEGRDTCRLALVAAVPEKPEGFAFLLDMDYFLSQPKSISVADVMKWVESAHDELVRLFEGSITDRLRTFFNNKSK